MTRPTTETLGGTASGPMPPATAKNRSRWLAGVSGKLRFLVEQTPVLTMIVEAGEVRVTTGDGPADTTVICASKDDMNGLIRGELNPVIIGLLGRLEIEGDVALGLQVLHALREMSVAPPGSADRAA